MSGNFFMSPDYYQDVFNILADVLPEEWDDILFRGCFAGSSCDMKYYADLGDGKYVDCFHIEEIDRDRLLDSFAQIYELSQAEREQLPPDQLWTAVTMRVGADGDFNADFDYDDLSETMSDYIAQWEKKYLVRE